MARRKEAGVPEEGADPGVVSAPEPAVCVKYTGGDTGDQYIMGVPTTDLHDVPAGEAESLTESGLYVLIPRCSHGE